MAAVGGEDDLMAGEMMVPDDAALEGLLRDLVRAFWAALGRRVWLVALGLECVLRVDDFSRRISTSTPEGRAAQGGG